MNTAYISLRNVLAKPLNALLTVIMLAMGVGLISLLILVGEALDQSFKSNIRGIDMVVGAKGSPLQLILSAVYHIDNPTGNISRKEARRVSSNSMVESVIELSFGDSYKGRRILGTSHEYAELYGLELGDGRLWNAPFEATIGARIAAEHGLKTGDTFYSAHGSDANAEAHEDHPYTVVGVFETSGTVVDVLLLTSLESVWMVHDTPGDTIPPSEREITAMLVKFKNKMGIITLPRFVNQQTSMQAALPSIEVNRLFSLFGVGITALQYIAIAIMVLGAVSVFISMVSSLRERSFEMALLRASGASRMQIFGMVELESVLLSVAGIITGLLLSRAAIGMINNFSDQEFGIFIDFWRIHPSEILLSLFTVLLCTFAASIPAIITSRIDVSKTLSNYA